MDDIDPYAFAGNVDRSPVEASEVKKPEYASSTNQKIVKFGACNQHIYEIWSWEKVQY